MRAPLVSMSASVNPGMISTVYPRYSAPAVYRGRSMSLIAWRVSADPVVKPAAQTRAESRVLNVRKQKRERDRLSAGGRRIRTLGPRWGTRFFRDISESGHDKPSWPRE